jgi:hypothetical protein
MPKLTRLQLLLSEVNFEVQKFTKRKIARRQRDKNESDDCPLIEEIRHETFTEKNQKQAFSKNFAE